MRTLLGGIYLSCVFLTSAVTGSSDYTFDNSKIGYTPSRFTVLGHMMTKMDPEVNYSYGEIALRAPIAIGVFGLLCMFFLQCGFLFRCCLKSCKCLPKYATPSYDSSKRMVVIAFFLLNFLVIAFDCVGIYGNKQLTNSVNVFKTSIDAVNTIVVDVIADTDAMLSYTGEISADLTAMSSTTCYDSSTADEISGYINSYEDQMNNVINALDNVPSRLNTIQNDIDLYTGQYRAMAFYGVWGFGVVTPILMIIAHFANSPGVMKFSMTFATISYFLYWVLGMPLILLTVVLSDFCMNPIQAIGRNLPSGTDQLTYYSTCSGTKGEVLNFTTANSYLGDLQSQLASIQSNVETCEQFTNDDAALNYVEAMNTTFYALSDTLAYTEDTLSCENFQSILLNTLDNGVCDGLQSGIFLIWGAWLFTSVFLFFLVWNASHMYHFYESYYHKLSDLEFYRYAASTAPPAEDEEEDYEDVGPTNHEGDIEAYHPVQGEHGDAEGVDERELQIELRNVAKHADLSNRKLPPTPPHSTAPTSAPSPALSSEDDGKRSPATMFRLRDSATPDGESSSRHSTQSSRPTTGTGSMKGKPSSTTKEEQIVSAQKDTFLHL